MKTAQFREPRYVGDPINAVRIFNDKQADELMVLDIGATASGAGPDEEAIAAIVSEAFMPVGYGGGITSVEMAERLVRLGVEKVLVNTAVAEAPNLISAMASHLGSSTLVVSIDAARRADGTYEVRTHSGTRAVGGDVVEYAQRAEESGAGEILLTSIDRDGMRSGYDLKLISAVASAVTIPVVACGGAGSLDDLQMAIVDAGAAAVAAGSLFVFHGQHRAVLITYPSYAARLALFEDRNSES